LYVSTLVEVSDELFEATIRMRTSGHHHIVTGQENIKEKNNKNTY
jgi:hypothetical protein